MAIYLGNVKQNELYYGGTKIKEAYYGSTKVYSSFTPQTTRFDYTGSFQVFTVPSGCTKLIVDCVGACGKDETYSEYYGRLRTTKHGGNGGRVQCVLSVTPGDILYIYIGGKPTSLTSATYNASDIRTNSNGITDLTSLSSRLLVAGGGGSAGSGTYNDPGTVVYHGGDGGAGGGLTGNDGSSSTYAPGGKGGTQTSGGKSGNGISAGNGSFGLGGFFGSSSSSYNTGQGGSGWYGGGSGGISLQDFMINTGGGGGGSSYTDPNLCTDVVHTQGYSEATGNGWIIITTH